MAQCGSFGQFSRSGEVENDPTPISPEIEITRDELRSLIDPDRPGIANPRENTSQSQIHRARERAFAVGFAVGFSDAMESPWGFFACSFLRFFRPVSRPTRAPQRSPERLNLHQPISQNLWKHES